MSNYGLKCLLPDGTAILDTSNYGLSYHINSGIGLSEISASYGSAPASFSQVEWVECSFSGTFNPGNVTPENFQNACLKLAITTWPDTATPNVGSAGAGWDVQYGQIGATPTYTNNHVTKLSRISSKTDSLLILGLENNVWLSE